MRAQLLLTALLVVFASTRFDGAVAQNTTAILAPGVLPPCALTCEKLLKAQAACQTPPPANGATPRNCFCQSSLTTALAKSANGVCDVECPQQQDRAKLQSWYTGYCKDTLPTSSFVTSTTSSSSSSDTTPATAATVSASTAPKPRRNGISRGATIGIAVGASVGLILVCVAVYFPVFAAASRAMRNRTPTPTQEGEKERVWARKDSGDAGSGSKNRPGGGGLGDADVHGKDANGGVVHVITAFKH